jgi:excisionase family DNA binding protein
MSWSALAWATDSDVGPPATKFILILLANKADENYSCYPSIRTLMAESNAGRSTVLRARSRIWKRVALLAVPRAAQLLGISRAAAYRLVASGELPVRRLGGRVYVVTAGLRELLAS